MLLRQFPLQQSDPRMHDAPGAPASQPPPLARQTLLPWSQFMLQQSEFRLQKPLVPAQPPPPLLELPPPLDRQTLLAWSQFMLQQSEFRLQWLPVPAQPPELLPLPAPLEDVMVHIVPCDT